MKIEATFTEVVQLHERKWGTMDYPGRPSLDQLLSSYIVLMWLVGKRFVLSVHKDAAEVNDLVNGLMTGQVADPHNRKLARIFVNQQPIDFRIKVVTSVKPEAQPAQDVLTLLNRQPEVVPLARQPELVPLPKHPGMKYGELLPGRHATPLPGRNKTVIKTRLKSKPKWDK